MSCTPRLPATLSSWWSWSATSPRPARSSSTLPAGGSRLDPCSTAASPPRSVMSSPSKYTQPRHRRRGDPRRGCSRRRCRSTSTSSALSPTVRSTTCSTSVTGHSTPASAGGREAGPFPRSRTRWWRRALRERLSSARPRPPSSGHRTGHRRTRPGPAPDRAGELAMHWNNAGGASNRVVRSGLAGRAHAAAARTHGGGGMVHAGPRRGG